MTKASASGPRVGPGDFTERRIPLRDLALPDGPEVHLWYLDLECLGHSLRHALGTDRDPEMSAPLTLAQLRFARRFYLRLLLGAYLGIPGKSVRINRGERGKPVLDEEVHDTPLHFSMAKSGSGLLIGFSTSSHIGVDLEPAGRKTHDAGGVARRYFSPDESEALDRIDEGRRDEAFLRAWACKEAVVKVSGRGIANNLCRFTVEMDPDLPPALRAIDDDAASNWSLALLVPVDGLIGAVAANQPSMNIQAFSLR